MIARGEEPCSWASARPRRRARRPRPGEIGEHQRARRRGRERADDGHARACAAQRVVQLPVGRAQPVGGAERDDQHVDGCPPARRSHLRSRRRPRAPGVPS